ncbi:MAG: pyridoxal-phosphate dependent enzyme [Chromatiales bacterium]|nr:pyridoxal-phosphate dependent enzyme [Chromatiales bacterium]
MEPDYLERILTAQVLRRGHRDAAGAGAQPVGAAAEPRCCSSARTCSRCSPSSCAAPTTRWRSSAAGAAAARGVIAASAGNHAQGVALAAQQLGCRAVIVMPATTPRIKVDAVEGARRARSCWPATPTTTPTPTRSSWRRREKLTFVHPYDDPGRHRRPGHHRHGDPAPARQGRSTPIFCCVGGGGLIAGVAAYVKRLRPEIKIIGVAAGRRRRDGALARRRRGGCGWRRWGCSPTAPRSSMVGEETFRLCRQYVDEMILVDTDAICAAIKDVFEDTRSILEPAGALAVAGAKEYAARTSCSDKTLVAVACGANMNFDRLRFVAERAEVGEQREAVLAVTIPEKPGSFQQVLRPARQAQRSPSSTTATPTPSEAHVFVGVQVAQPQRDRRAGRRARAPHGLPTPRPDRRRDGQAARPPHGGRPRARGGERGRLPLRVPRAARRADEVPRPA